jgi:serine protease AprX
MKKIYVLFLLCFFSLELFSQTPTKHWVQFTDKNNSPYSLSNPSAYLSPRAIARRVAQNISIDSADLPVNPSYVAGVAATGATVHAHSKWLNGVVVFTSNLTILGQIAALPYVSSVNGVGFRESSNTDPKFSDETFQPVPNTQRTGSVESLMLNYGSSFNQINMLGGVCLHNANFQGQGMQIAVLDAGFFNANVLSVFDSLYLNNRILGTWDFVAGDSSVYEDNTHGTMVLSCMGGNLPGQLVGTAPEASYWLLRSEEAATEYLVEEYYWASAAEFADSVGADVINSSLGYTRFDDPSQDHTYADMDGVTVPCTRAANYAASRGMMVVVSAGNSGQNTWFYIGAPSDADSALAIAATDASGIVTGFSSRGFAPDGGIKPNLGAQGGNSVVCDPFTNGAIQTGNGTSFASPILCGLVACLWQAHPSMNQVQLKNVIELSASQYSNPDSLLGYGIPDFCAANLYLGGYAPPVQNQDGMYGFSPSPFSTEFQFTFYSTQEQYVSITLFDSQGRRLMEQYVYAMPDVENMYRISELASLTGGVYFVQVKTQDGIFTQQVVKLGN